MKNDNKISYKNKEKAVIKKLADSLSYQLNYSVETKIAAIISLISTIKGDKRIVCTPKDESFPGLDFNYSNFISDTNSIGKDDDYIYNVSMYLFNFINHGGGGITVRIYGDKRDSVFGMLCSDDETFILSKDILRKCYTTCSECGEEIPDGGEKYLGFYDVIKLIFNV